jgi:hypothetical protein
MQRRDRLIQEHRHDPYEARSKPREPSACPRCHAIFHGGRWQWGQPAADAHEVVCPACLRVADDMPAGLLVLSGDFHLAHRPEILGLIRHVEEREAGQHPLKRIMRVTEADDEVTIATCEASLARAIGQAIHHAYQGELDFHYGDGDLLRVRWHR